MNRKFLAGLLGVSLVVSFALPSFAMVGEGDFVGRAQVKQIASGTKITAYKECASCIKNNRPQGDPELTCSTSGSCMGDGTCAGKRSGKCVCKVVTYFKENQTQSARPGSR